MTTNTAGAQPAAPERAPAIGESGFTPHPHAEDAELASLEAAAAQAEAAAAQGGEQPVEPAADAPVEEQPAAPAATPTDDQPRDESGRWIPKARFDEAVTRERERSEKAIAAAAYYKGQLDAKAAGGQPGAPQMTVEQEIAALHDAVEKKAEDFDGGKIGLTEFKRFERQVNQRLAVLQQPAPSRQEPTAPQDMTLEERTEDLGNRFPVLHDLDQRVFRALQPLAEMELAAAGASMDGGPLATFRLRERMAQIAQERYGRAQAQPAPQPSTPAGRQPDPTKAAREKIALAGRMPPNLNKAGVSNVDGGKFTPDQIRNMDLDDLAKLPDSTLRALSGQ